MSVTPKDFVDRIYEAASVVELWPKVLDDLTTVADGSGCVMFAANPSSAHWIASHGMEQLVLDWFRDGWAQNNTRGARLQAAQTAGFIREIDIYESRCQIENDAQIREFLRPRGLGWAVGTFVAVPTGDNLIFSIEREFAKGPVENAAVTKLNIVRPHLARAALLSARLGLERARAMAQAMQAIGLPAAVLRRGGRLVATNAMFEKLMPATIEDRRNRIVLTNPDSDRLLVNTLAKLDLGIKQGEVLSIAIPSVNGQLPMALHLVPVCGMAHDIFSQATSVLIATPVDRSASPNAELLEGLFDLTPTEAKIARAIGQAHSIEAIGAAHNVSVNTVRNQLRSIFTKTGTGRQAELVRLLSGLVVRGSID